MLPSIPASAIVSVNPAVLGVGGNPLTLNTVLFTDVGNSPINTYTSADSVAAAFGFDSPQHIFAQNYFNGYVGSTIKPSTLIIARYNKADRAAALVGASLKSMELEELKLISGSLAVVIDGESKSGSVNLSDVKSFSEAASTIAQALSINIEFDTLLQAFIISSGSTGDGSTIAYATGDIAFALGLTEDSGAIIDNFTLADTASTAMKKVFNYTLNFAVITTLGESFTVNTDKDFAKWTSKQNNRYWFIQYGKEATATIANNNTCFGAFLKEYAISGVSAIYGTYEHAAIACGYAASLDFSELNGRATMEFKRGTGVSASVTDADIANALETNGYVYYGAFATANDRFIFMRNSRVSGDFKWIDSYLNQIYLNSQLQLAMLNMLMSYKSIPYNTDGAAIHRAAAGDPIQEMLNFGGIQKNVELSEGQASQINYEAGVDAARQVVTTGYYLLIGKATAQIRSQRASLPLKLWYADGGSVHTVNIASINVQ